MEDFSQLTAGIGFTCLMFGFIHFISSSDYLTRVVLFITFIAGIGLLVCSWSNLSSGEMFIIPFLAGTAATALLSIVVLEAEEI